MRWVFRIFKWMGLGLTMVLLLATTVFWVRNLGHGESWVFTQAERRPDKKLDLLPQAYALRLRAVTVVRGRLWLVSVTATTHIEAKPNIKHDRAKCSPEEAEQHFDRVFKSGPVPFVNEAAKAWDFLGLGVSHRRTVPHPWTGQADYEIVTLAIPLWMLAVLFGLWPGLFVLGRLLRKKRYAAGMCQGCGYDLRATPDPTGPRLPRCPECGREVVPQAH